MKRVLTVVALIMAFSVSLFVREVHADTGVSDEYIQSAKNLIEQYNQNQKSKEQGTTDDSRFTNDMVENQQKLETTLQYKIEEAKENGEKFYSLDDILKANADVFGISEADMEKIKQSVKQQIAEDDKLLGAFAALGESDHPVAKAIQEDRNSKLPKSVIYVDHSIDEQDGKISGGGWPYCLDDNGYGPSNFITSDCYKAIIAAAVCASDSTLGKMSSKLRYCKAYVRNCSPLIGHSKNWHTHKWYQKIP